MTERASARSAGSSIPAPALRTAGCAGSAGWAPPRWILRRVRSVGAGGPGRVRQDLRHHDPAAARRLGRDHPGSGAIRVLPGNACHRHARAPGPFPERPECRVRPRTPAPAASRPAARKEASGPPRRRPARRPGAPAPRRPGRARPRPGAEAAARTPTRRRQAAPRACRQPIPPARLPGQWKPKNARAKELGHTRLRPRRAVR